MGFNPDRLTFKVDEITGEIIQPKIFLCDRQLNKTGEIYPVNDLRIKSVLNGADEISFSTPEHAENYNGKDVAYINKKAFTPVAGDENPMYGRLRDYSVVLAEGFGYFEVSPTVNDTYTPVKNLHGSSLGESELSQLFCTLECNTDDDMVNFLKLHPAEKFIPTVLYSDDDEHRHSLIHRILSYAPNYEVGHVDDTLKNIQRTFSFSKKDIISCFSEIAEEVSCIFDVVVRKNEDGIVERVVNIYDAQYCKDCGKRNIINGVCQNPTCKSTNITSIGEDTNIVIGTDNLSDEITLTPDGNMKNCFIIEGGDDIITSAVEGILPSGNNKLYMFSPDTAKLFSPELQAKFAEYMKGFNKSREAYGKLLELEYNIFDLILYLQSGRMPTAEISGNLHEETEHILDEYNTHFPNGLGLTDTSDTTSRNGLVRQVFSLFADDGYAVKQENGNYDAEKLRWTGDIIVYEIGNSNSQAVISISDNSSTIKYSDSTTAETIPFCVKFSEDYPTYLKQMVAVATKNHELIEDQVLNSPKDWQRYSLNRLYSYKSGYELCIQTLNELESKSGLADVESAVNDMRDKYQQRIGEISGYMTRLEDIIYHLYFYLGSVSSHESPSSATSSSNVNYSEYTPEIFQNTATAFQNMTHYIRYGTWNGGSRNDLTDRPVYCKDCGSSNITLNGCNQCKSSNISTYGDIAQMICDSYALNQTSLETQRAAIRKHNNLHDFLGDILYKELCSFIREDVYQNSNFISDGLSNSELILKTKELVQKAEQELAKACISQHTLSGNVYSFVAYSRLSGDDFPIKGVYDTFKLGNFMWYISDEQDIRHDEEYETSDSGFNGKKAYKLRLSSEEFSWTDSGAELNVEFTDMVEYSGGGISDLASLMQKVNSLSTSFNSVKKQAGQGVQANQTFQKIKNEGLQSALSNVLNARDIDVQMDEHGITLRKFDYELDGYDRHQMKLINRNIVMTDDNWKTARMAIGLGRYGEDGNAELVYGVWADLLVGDMIVGNNLRIENDKGTVEITGDSIKITKGVITWDNVNSPEISNINGLANRLDTLDTSITAAETNANEYTDRVSGELSSSLTDAYKTYADSAVARLDSAVANYFRLPESTTLVGENFVISPYIGGGYLNITGQSDSVQNQVIIDPENLTETGYVFAVKHGTDFTVGIKPDGSASFKGDITATSLTLDGCELPYEKISGKPSIPSDIKDLSDTNQTLKNIMYKGDITSETKKDSYGNMYTEHTVQNGTASPIKYTTYSTDSYVLFGRAAGSGTMGGEGTYACISKDGLLQANNAIIYGTIYATNGEFSGSIKCGDGFSVTSEGKIKSSSGEIGGWKITTDDLRRETGGSTSYYSNLLSATQNKLIFSHRQKTNPGDPYFKCTEISVGNSEGVISKSGRAENGNSGKIHPGNCMQINYDGIIYKYTDDSGNEQNIFSVGKYYQNGTNIPYEGVFDASFGCQVKFKKEIFYKGDNKLSEIFCVVKTGEKSSSGTEGWKDIVVNFGITYSEQPFISVMPVIDNQFNEITEKIVFKEFTGNSTDGYTGFKYSVYCTNFAIEYKTKWFAAGNKKI